MLNLKKKASFEKLEDIFTKNKLLLCCHCNNMNTSEWFLLKKELSKLDLLKGVNTLLVKNKTAKKWFIKMNSTSSFVEEAKQISANGTKVTLSPNLFQGPTFIIGCKYIDLVAPLVKLISSNKKLLIVGGILEKQIINNLDLNLLKKLDKSIFNELVSILVRPHLNFISVFEKQASDTLFLTSTLAKTVANQ